MPDVLRRCTLSIYEVRVVVSQRELDKGVVVSVEYLIASSSNYQFDIDGLAAAVLDRWPGSELTHPEGRLGELAPNIVYLPAIDDRSTEISFQHSGGGIGIDSPHTEQVAELVAWLVREAPVPADGSVLLLEWALDLLPLTPTTSASDLLAAHRCAR